MRYGACAVTRPRLRPQSSRPPGDVARAELTAARASGPISYVEALAAAQEAAKRLRELCPALEAR